MHFLRDRATTVKIPRRWQQIHREGTQVRRELRLELGRQPSDIEIAEALEISLKEWQAAKLAASNRKLISLNAQVSTGGQEDVTMTLGDTLTDPRAQILKLNQEDRLELQQAMMNLEDTTRQVLEAVFFQQLSRKEVAEAIGVDCVLVSHGHHPKKKLETKAQVVDSFQSLVNVLL